MMYEMTWIGVGIAEADFVLYPCDAGALVQDLLVLPFNDDDCLASLMHRGL
jgi:hypothetical protein